MPLLLRIDNVDRLPDGGPVTCELDRRGIDIGRDPYLDWTLPDPDRIVSGKHCELRYRDGGYWLHDVSTNGTTINGRGGRLTEPYRLQDGDRVHIGHYIIAVELKGEDAAPTPPPVASPFAGNVWDDVPDAAAAVDRHDFAARARAGAEPGGPRGPAELPEEDIGWSIGELTPGALAPDDPVPGDPWNTPPAGKESRDAWGWDSPPPAGAAVTPPRGPAPAGTPDPFGAPDATTREFASDAAPDIAVPRSVPPSEPCIPAAPSALHPAAQAAALQAAGSSPAAAPAAAPPSGETSRHAPAGLAGQWTGGALKPTPQPRGPTDGHPPATGGGFVAAFERGAGLPSGSVAAASGADDAFAEELGALFRLVARHLHAMLLARAETKGAMRSAERTMIGALENNPLKFSPTPEDALRIMFGARTRSYLDARATLEASFGDLQRHQVQTFGAMQGALQALIDDLDPKAIEAATPEEGGLAGIVGSRRARLWDTYVERFRAKSGRHERGMIDAFMLLFAEMYDRQR